MSETKRPQPVKLIVAVLFSDEAALTTAKAKLKQKFGPLDFQSPAVPFDVTKYYRQEMGPELKRCFFGFQRLINPERLAAIKLYTNRLEQRLSRKRGRPSRLVNLDPGYISAAKLVLATGKDYAHRIYLEKGIFAEVTLHFRDGTFQPWPWTYPDYRTADYIHTFNKIREIYLKQLHCIFL